MSPFFVFHFMQHKAAATTRRNRMMTPKIGKSGLPSDPLPVKPAQSLLSAATLNKEKPLYV